MSVKCAHCGESLSWFSMIKSIFKKFEIQCPSCNKYSQATGRSRTSVNLLCILIPCMAGVISLNIWLFLAVYGGMLFASPVFLKYEKQKKK